MDTNKTIELWQEKLTGEITEEREKLLNELLSSDKNLANELRAMEETWLSLDNIQRPEPTSRMDAKFEGMLAAHMENKRSGYTLLDSILARINQSWQVGLATLVIGLFIGWWMLPTQGQKEDIQQLSGEIQSMKEMMMLTLIEQPKAQERIRAVNLAAELPKADEKVIDALITTLNYDENVNVRLASLEALIQYSGLPEVRKALVSALAKQESALIQVAIADVLVQIQEKSSVQTMEKLKEDIDNEIVKEKLEQSIQTLRQS